MKLVYMLLLMSIIIGMFRVVQYTVQLHTNGMKPLLVSRRDIMDLCFFRILVQLWMQTNIDYNRSWHLRSSKFIARYCGQLVTLTQMTCFAYICKVVKYHLIFDMYRENRHAKFLVTFL